MKISVLTTSCNAETTLRFTIDSFLAQDYPEKEMIILDGGSADKTLEIAKSYGDAVHVYSAPDCGMYDALNKGLKLFAGDAMGTLNADDTYHDSSVLGRIADALSEADIVHGDLDFVADHARKRVVRRWRAADRPGKGFLSGWMPAHPTFYVRRKVVETVGNFDLSLTLAADYDWMLRAVELCGMRTNRIHYVLIDMKQGGASTSGVTAYIKHNLQSLKARRKWLGSGIVDSALIAKPARKVSQFLIGMNPIPFR